VGKLIKEKTSYISVKSCSYSKSPLLLLIKSSSSSISWFST